MKNNNLISVETLRLLESKGIKKLTPYTHKNPRVRNLFWKRINALLSIGPDVKKTKVLDFGCGSGILLAVLAKKYDNVTGLDINIESAKITIKTLKIKKVNLKQADGNKKAFKDDSFDAVYAADVLEHFMDLNPVINNIADMLKPNGVLLISGPTENLLYRIGRMFFGHKKPKDHYHTINQIMNAAKKRFVIEKVIKLPFNNPLIPSLFKIVRMRVKKQATR